MSGLRRLEKGMFRYALGGCYSVSATVALGNANISILSNIAVPS